MFCMGVNDDTFDPAAHTVVSNASCTTNCFVPMIKVLDDAFGIEQGLMTTVHAYTSDQQLGRRPAHKPTCAGRAPRAVKIIPSSTGAARAIGLVLPSHEGQARRHVAAGARCPTGSITDFVGVLDARRRPSTRSTTRSAGRGRAAR